MATKSLKYWVIFLLSLLISASLFARSPGLQQSVSVADLPKEAQRTLALIKQGGPFPYAKDGAIFGNYERILPKQKRGYYHEFTVKTPWARNRGARRIVVGGDLAAPQEFYYTDNHYATFRRIIE